LNLRTAATAPPYPADLCAPQDPADFFAMIGGLHNLLTKSTYFHILSCMDSERLAGGLAAAGAALRDGPRPGDIGEIIRLHGILYAKEHGYSLAFDAYVAKTFSDYAWPLGDRERLWIVEKDGSILGCIAIVQASPAEAQLRWLLLDPRIRGCGLGGGLVADAVDFSRACGYEKVILWTEGSLVAATALYRKAGFVLTQQKPGVIWGAARVEERYELPLS
jgi:GNAT superfamily N-acetyltransferase